MVHASEKKVLVVDDEPDVRNYLAACIEDAGFNVETAVDGIDAMEKVEKDPPDLITLDMVMPRMSGIRVMRALRKKKEWAKIPVIVITAHMHDEFGKDDIEALMAFPAALRPIHNMEKPITPSNLIKNIGIVLEVDVDLDEDKDNASTSELKGIKDLFKKR